MAISLNLEAETRQPRGKGGARQLRREGRIPATLYGARKDALSLAIDPKQVSRILRSEGGHNSIFNLTIAGGETTAAMVVDWQREPMRGALLHVDLKRIALDQLIRVKVPVHTTGEAVGVKQQGGILEVVTREIEIECLPGEIPEAIPVDVSALSIGQNLRVGDVKLDGNRRILTDADRVVAHVVSVKEVVEAAPAAGEAAPAAAEPEVIKKGKAEAEGEAEAGKEGKEGKEKEKKK